MKKVNKLKLNNFNIDNINTIKNNYNDENLDNNRFFKTVKVKYINFRSDFENGDILVSSHQSCTSILVLWLTGEDILISNGSLLAIEIKKPSQGAGKILWQESQSGNEIKRAIDFVDQF